MADSGPRGVISERNVKFMELFISDDMKALSELYTEDCKFMGPGNDTQVGRKCVEEAFSGIKASGVTRLSLESEEVGGVDGGDTLFERGQYQQYRDDGTVNESGKYVVIWKKVDGEYYLGIDCFNTNE
ncbi:uncharacterized protein LOC144437402 [Glandiceps talaboti]